MYLFIFYLFIFYFFFFEYSLRELMHKGENLLNSERVVPIVRRKGKSFSFLLKV